jgi:hypothetical protein
MSLHLPAVLGDASAQLPLSPPTNTRVLASILSDIGASQFLPNFLDAQQDDSCIHSFRVAKAVEKFYGLPLQMAAEFVEKCSALASRGAQPAGNDHICRLWHAPSVNASCLHYSLSLFALPCVHINRL